MRREDDDLDDGLFGDEEGEGDEGEEDDLMDDEEGFGDEEE